MAENLPGFTNLTIIHINDTMGEDLWDIERKKAAIQFYILYNITQIWKQNTLFFFPADSSWKC